MIKSMTGFAHRDIASPAMHASLDLKSYNNRYLDLAVYLPSYLSRFEPRIREYLSSRIVHGKVELSVKVKSLHLPVEARADTEAAKAASKALRDIAAAAGIDEPLRLSSLLALEGVLSFEREIDEDGLWTILSSELEALFASFDESRLREGETTKNDILQNLARLERNADKVRVLVPEIESTVKTQLRDRFREVLGDALDENRYLSELAVLLMKYTIHEELSRLGSHFQSFRRILEGDTAPGKKLDFLCQEMNREVNTIGSKNMLIEISEAVVELKDALENIREQLRNIE